MLEIVGDLPGIDIYRTPGEEAAIAIVTQLVLDSSLKQLDKAASRTKGKAEPFWSKQW
jgi:hypothetical protein